MNDPCIEQFSGPYIWLSNFYLLESPIIDLNRNSYPTVEHFYVAGKTTDLKIRNEISKLSTPGKAKRFGRDLNIREDWDSVKYNIMYFAVVNKFSKANPVLRAKLIASKFHTIREGNEWGDLYWGVDLWTKEGQNNLGKIIMKVRDLIDTEV